MPRLTSVDARGVKIFITLNAEAFLKLIPTFLCLVVVHAILSKVDFFIQMKGNLQNNSSKLQKIPNS